MAEQKKKVLLLGGTGAMGVYLVPELQKLGYEVYITSRSPHSSMERDKIFITGNAKDKTFLRRLLNIKFDAIVDFMVYNTKEFEERYMELLDSTPHYLFLSSYRVYGDNHGNPITETSPRLLDSVKDPEYLSTDEYGLTKARQENMLRKSGRKNWTILRPAVTYSKERFQLGTMEAHEFLKRAFQNKPIIFPKEMLGKYATMSWAGDVAKLISLLVMNEKAMGEAFTVSTSECHTWEEVMNYYVELLDMKVKLVDLDVYRDIIGRPYQIKYDRMLDRVIDNSKALNATGMRQEDFMPLKDGLRIELNNFAKKPVFKATNAKWEARIDEITAPELKSYTVKTEKKKVSKVKRKAKGAIRRLSKVRGAWRVKKAVYKVRNKVDRSKQLKKEKACHGAIVTLTGGYNYGSVIQRWALQNFLKKNGYNFKVFDFDFMRYMSKKVGDRTVVEKFIEKNLDTENFVPQKAKRFDRYIVGSDQVWRDFFGEWDKFGNFFLSFLGEKKAKRIGYAISFGFDKWSEPYTIPKEKARISNYVKKFDAVSVREKSGIKLVEELGNEAVHVLDPTLLMRAKDYSKLIDKSQYKKEYTAPLFYYILDFEPHKMEIIDKISKVKNMDVAGIIPTDGKQLVSPEIWLKGFRDSKMVITDSFHGTVFSIINHKPFYVFTNKKRGNARLKELLDMLGVADRLIFAEDINYDELNENIDWKDVEKRLDALRKHSGDWLLNALKD